MKPSEIRRIASDLVNGNLTDAKSRARHVGQPSLLMGLHAEGWPFRRAAAAAFYLKHPSQSNWQAFCDAAEVGT